MKKMIDSEKLKEWIKQEIIKKGEFGIDPTLNLLIGTAKNQLNLVLQKIKELEKEG
jgi:hypothetical protein